MNTLSTIQRPRCMHLLFFKAPFYLYTIYICIPVRIVKRFSAAWIGGPISNDGGEWRWAWTSKGTNRINCIPIDLNGIPTFVGTFVCNGPPSRSSSRSAGIISARVHVSPICFYIPSRFRTVLPYPLLPCSSFTRETEEGEGGRQKKRANNQGRSVTQVRNGPS